MVYFGERLMMADRLLGTEKGVLANKPYVMNSLGRFCAENVHADYLQSLAMSVFEEGKNWTAIISDVFPKRILFVIFLVRVKTGTICESRILL